MKIPTCKQRGAQVSATHIECFSDHFAGPDFAHRPLTLCAKPCPFADKPQLKESHPHLFRTGEPCTHRGEPTGETIECPSCTGTVRIKTFACEIHQTCTLQKQVDGAVCCAGCGDYAVDGLK